ncbi:HNH endonuclease [Priestia megaterium]|uniref:HNH endonuclease n=1 Tax=Priestia megaterium TaxID=1404 RepID=UPI002877CA62|nr:HNH endonuclease [Priestia megaterium]
MKNKYRTEDDYTFILLKNRKGLELETIIDNKYFNEVKELNLSWHLQWDNHTKTYYCKATRQLGIIDGKRKCQTVYLHHIVIPLTKDKHVIHHKNHDTLDNREHNLEEISNRENIIQRRGANPNNSTGVRNVSWIKKEQKYAVQLQINGVNKCLGKFDTLEEASTYAIKMRGKYYGIHKY